MESHYWFLKIIKNTKDRKEVSTVLLSMRKYDNKTSFVSNIFPRNFPLPLDLSLLWLCQESSLWESFLKDVKETEKKNFREQLILYVMNSFYCIDHVIVSPIRAPDTTKDGGTPDAQKRQGKWKTSGKGMPTFFTASEIMSGEMSRERHFRRRTNTASGMPLPTPWHSRPKWRREFLSWRTLCRRMTRRRECLFRHFFTSFVRRKFLFIFFKYIISNFFL